MGVSYNRLWKMLIDKNMKRIEMQYLTGISGNILARMGKNQYDVLFCVPKHPDIHDFGPRGMA